MKVEHIVLILDHPIITHSLLESLHKNREGVSRTTYQETNQGCCLLRVGRASENPYENYGGLFD
jgi:hypothetical protein